MLLLHEQYVFSHDTAFRRILRAWLLFNSHEDDGCVFGFIRSRFTEPFVFFGLPEPSSVSPFGRGISVDGSV